jgi:hypothetical protein
MVTAAVLNARLLAHPRNWAGEGAFGRIRWAVPHRLPTGAGVSLLNGSHTAAVGIGREHVVEQVP